MSAMFPEDVSLSLTTASTMPAVTGSFQKLWCSLSSSITEFTSEEVDQLFDIGLRLEMLIRCWIHKLVRSRCRSLPRHCRLQIPTAAELPVHSLRGNA